MPQKIFNIVSMLIIGFTICGIAAYITESRKKRHAEREQLKEHKHWWN